MSQDDDKKSANFDKFLRNFKRMAVVGFSRAWRDISSSAKLKITGHTSPDLNRKEEKQYIFSQMQECLDAKGGEVKERIKTVELGKTYLSLNDAGKEVFLKILAEKFDLDKKQVQNSIKNYQQLADDKSAKREDVTKSILALQNALIAPRQRILKQFNSLPNGFKFLVDLRADLLRIYKSDVSLEAMENDLRALLANWFDIGLLDLERITWSSPAVLLEKLIAYEAVHEIRSWNDMKNRLDSDRRCYAFFHNKMEYEPLIFVEVALVNGIASNVQTLLDESTPVGNPEAADTAIFYSISNAQKGLSGISFGNFLIKRVVERLSKELPNINTFCTLSPVPAFMSWFEKNFNTEYKLTQSEIKDLQALAPVAKMHEFIIAKVKNFANEDAESRNAIKNVMIRVCADYLVNAKKNGKALDPVAHFHLSNGARLEQINWLGDCSAKGYKQSCGIMVNYLYHLSDIDSNYEKYEDSGKASISRQVKALLKQ